MARAKSIAADKSHTQSKAQVTKRNQPYGTICGIRGKRGVIRTGSVNKAAWISIQTTAMKKNDGKK